jgi:hypothetical protein
MRRRNWLLLAILPLAAACTPPVEAPAELGELSLYLFENFEGTGEDGADALPAGLAGLSDYLVGLDLEGDVDGRAVTPPKLPYARLGGASTMDGAEEALQVPVAVSGLVQADMNAQAEMSMDTNQVCIASDTTTYQQQTFGSDADPEAFISGAVDRIESDHEVFVDSLSDGWMDKHQQYVWVEMEDGRMAMISRGWMTDAETVKGDLTWDQRFELNVFIPANGDDGVMRFYSMWSSVTGLGDDAYAVIVKNGLDEYYENSDAHWLGEDCDNDRDAARPE